MQIQSIQTNNYSKTSFKAYFVANEQFNCLWKNSKKTSDCFAKYVKTIADNYKGHKLEITDYAALSNGEDMYRICNHSTGKTHDCSLHRFHFGPPGSEEFYDSTNRDQLKIIMRELICDSKFWGEETDGKSSLSYAADNCKDSFITTGKMRDLLTDECYGLSYVINTENKEKRINEFKSYLSENDSSKINDFLKENCYELITVLHEKEWGWTHGKDKKALMIPLIEYVEKQAKEKGGADDKISEFKEKCLKELDAPFRTDKNNIIKALKDILYRFDNTPSKCLFADRRIPEQKKYRERPIYYDYDSEWLPW